MKINLKETRIDSFKDNQIENLKYIIGGADDDDDTGGIKDKKSKDLPGNSQ